MGAVVHKSSGSPPKDEKIVRVWPVVYGDVSSAFFLPDLASSRL